MSRPIHQRCLVLVPNVESGGERLCGAPLLRPSRSWFRQFDSVLGGGFAYTVCRRCWQHGSKWGRRPR